MQTRRISEIEINGNGTVCVKQWETKRKTAIQLKLPWKWEEYKKRVENHHTMNKE